MTKFLQQIQKVNVLVFYERKTKKLSFSVAVVSDSSSSPSTSVPRVSKIKVPIWSDDQQSCTKKKWVTVNLKTGGHKSY